MTCVHMTSLGAYVLGALDANDRLATERHLRECALCRDELVRLAPLPALLSQVSLSDLTEPDGPVRTDVDGPPPLPTRPIHRRRWFRRTVGAGAAAAAVLVGILVAGIVVGSSTTTPAATTWTTASDSAEIDATAVLSERNWGTDIDLTMEDLPMGQRCRLVVRSVDGRTETAGWWTTGYDSSAEVPASTSLDLASIDRLEVVLADGQVLATLDPDAS